MENMKRMREPAANGGFTLVEILLVIAILGLLATLVVPDVMGIHAHAKVEKGSADVSQLQGTVEGYAIRSKARELPTWEMLITPDERGKVWLPGYSRAPRDPWGNEYEIRPGDRGARNFEIRSRGPDGVAGTEDDISSRTTNDR